MNATFRNLSPARALIAGLFCGFISAGLIILYAMIYREVTGFGKIIAIGPLAVFIGVPITLVIISSFYFLFVHFLAKGELLYKILFSLLTIGGILIITNFDLSGGGTLLSLPHGFLFGLIIITGLNAAFFLPYLAHHPKIYLTAGEIKLDSE